MKEKLSRYFQSYKYKNVMDNHQKIYGKKQQIKIIDVILASLCTIELSPEGRLYLKKLKSRLQKDIDSMSEIGIKSHEYNL